MEIKAIETVYGGYRFRSRLEARWAVFFDALGIKYEYEKEGFDLGELGWYLPDFFLPESRWFIEVKGSLEDKDGIAKARYLDNYPPEDKNGDLVAWGCRIFTDIEYIKPANPDGYCIPDMQYSGPIENYKSIMPESRYITDEEFNNAVTKARQARFEHGEKG